MSPNPYILIRNLFTPHRWFRSNSMPGAARRVERWDEPVPGGAYEYIPGRGWFLIAVESGNDGELEKLDSPVPVVYCRILDRHLLKADYESRKKFGRTKDENGRDISGIFFRLDDGFTWLYRWKQDGSANPTDKMQPYVVDSETGQFRVKVRSDCTVVKHDTPETSTGGKGKRPMIVASPSVRSFVEGDIHRSNLPSTTPSTRPGTRPASSHGSSSNQRFKASTPTTPPTVNELRTAHLDAPELQRRLRTLKIAG